MRCRNKNFQAKLVTDPELIKLVGSSRLSRRIGLALEKKLIRTIYNNRIHIKISEIQVIANTNCEMSDAVRRTRTLNYCN